MTNLETMTHADVCLPLIVPTGTGAGEIVPLGTDGLIAVTQTPAATTTLINAGGCPGLKVDEASCILRGKSIVVNLTINAAIAAYAKVYKTAGGAYTPVATNNTHVGHTLDTLTAAGTARVAVL